jgi:type IV secretion system protein VirD4
LGRLLPGPTPFWGTVAALMSVAFIGAGLLAAASRRRQAGMATRAQIASVGREPDAGAAYGTYLGAAVRARGEDSALTIAPARAGKTTRLAVGRVVDAPGAVVATSTKADLVHLTAFARAGKPPAHVFDPDRLLGWPTVCRWDIVAGCDDVREAMTRARAMVAARPLGAGRNSSFFEGASETVLRCLLHAAAIDGKSMREVLGWARDFTDDTPYEILRTHPGAAPGWVADLRKFCLGAAPETVSSTSMSLSLILKSLADDRVVDLVCPQPGEGLDVEAFVRDGIGTLYLVSEGGDGVSTAPLVTAFASAVVSCARRVSQTRPGGRLDPPLTFVLDEAANVAPLPDMPAMMSDGGGRACLRGRSSSLSPSCGPGGAATAPTRSGAPARSSCSWADAPRPTTSNGSPGSSATTGSGAGPTPAQADSWREPTARPPHPWSGKGSFPSKRSAASGWARHSCSTARYPPP